MLYTTKTFSARKEFAISLKRLLPALVMMSVIFGFSATPASSLPTFGLLDLLVKKGGHMTGYALLAISYTWALEGKTAHQRVLPAAWSLAVFYAVTDELHQSFVPGRHASAADVLIDAVGAALGLYLWFRLKNYSNSKSNSSSS